MELGEWAGTWQLAQTSCQLSALMGIDEVPGRLVIRCGQLVTKQRDHNGVQHYHGRVVLSESPRCHGGGFFFPIILPSTLWT